MDLGTVVQEHDDAVRTAKKGGSKKGGSSRQRQAVLDLAASGVQIRPKRRMPVGKVGGEAGGVEQQAAVDGEGKRCGALQ